MIKKSLKLGGGVFLVKKGETDFFSFEKSAKPALHIPDISVLKYFPSPDVILPAPMSKMYVIPVCFSLKCKFTSQWLLLI